MMSDVEYAARLERAITASRGLGLCGSGCTLLTLADKRENSGTAMAPRWTRSITVHCAEHGTGVAKWSLGSDTPPGRTGDLLT